MLSICQQICYKNSLQNYLNKKDHYIKFFVCNSKGVELLNVFLLFDASIESPFWKRFAFQFLFPAAAAGLSC